MATKNPFPGMNPFFEQRWRGTHTTLITYICDSLQEQLPPDLVASPEEEVVTNGRREQAMAHECGMQDAECGIQNAAFRTPHSWGK